MQEYFDAASSVDGEAILVEAYVGRKGQQEQVASSPQPLTKRRRTNTNAEEQEQKEHTVLTHGLAGTEAAVAAFKTVVGFMDVLQVDRNMDAKWVVRT